MQNHNRENNNDQGKVERDNHEFKDCTTCGAPAIVVGHKDYNVDADGKVTETLVWQCQDLTKLHRFETVNEDSVPLEMVPAPRASMDPHLHQDKNFANLNQPNHSELPESASALTPDYRYSDARTEDGLTINDGTEGERTDAQFNQDGSYDDGKEFSDERPHASELTAGGAVVGDGEDQTLDENRTKKTRNVKNKEVRKDDGDDRISADEVG